MRKFLTLLFAGFAILAIASCSSSTGSWRLPGIGAPATAEENQTLGDLGAKYENFREWSNAILGDVKMKIDDQTRKSFADILKRLDPVTGKLGDLTNSPSSHELRGLVIAGLREFEAMMLNIDSARKHQPK